MRAWIANPLYRAEPWDKGLEWEQKAFNTTVNRGNAGELAKKFNWTFNNLIMKQSFYTKVFILIIIISCIYSCKKTILHDEQTMIEDNFLSIVDTSAYLTGSFRKPPQSQKLHSQLLIEVNKEIICNARIDELIDDYLNKDSNFKDFKDLFNKVKCNNFHLEDTFKEKIGKYDISFDRKIQSNKNYIGKIDFENLRTDGKNAILVLTKSQGNSGITYIILLSKSNGIWTVIKRDVLYQS